MTKFEIWLANLNPSKGSEVGKIRPVVIIQADYLNVHLDTVIVCPISSNPWSEKTNHIPISEKTGRLERDSVILLDQIRTLDKSRLIERLGVVPLPLQSKINANLKIVMDLE